MNEAKRKKLKKSVKLTVLAEQAGTSHVYLSKIIHNHAKPSLELADKLAKLANQMTFTDSFKAKDFL
tara:strand:- start:209 stop:409 length:201 start_codon:yes stop_codon:yes gene_type:complete